MAVWLLPCFVLDWGPKETLSLGCFFCLFFPLRCLLLSVDLGWAFTQCKDQGKQFLTGAADCGQQRM